jgi:hypothetical protein
MRPIQKDAAVIFVDGDGKHHKGTILEPISAGSARIELKAADDAGKGQQVAQGTYSDKAEPGTFHFADQADAVKKNRKSEPQPAAAASASSSKP